MRADLALVSSLWLATSAQAWALDCSPVDMRKPGGSMEGAPVMSQGAHGTCYSYAAAGIADAWTCRNLKKPRTREALEKMPRTSPIALAASSKALDRRKTTSSCNGVQTGCSGGDDAIDGGNCDVALNFLRDHDPAACSHRDVFGVSRVKRHIPAHGDPLDFDHYEMDRDEELSGLGMGLDMSTVQGQSGAAAAGRDSQYLQALKDAWDTFSKSKQPPSKAAAEAGQQLTCSLKALDITGTMMPGKFLENAASVVTGILLEDKSHSRLDFFDRYFKKACEGHTFGYLPKLPPVVSKSFDNNPSLKRRHDDYEVKQYIGTLLSRPEPLPVEISFCGDVLKDPDSVRGLVPEPTTVPDKDKKPQVVSCLNKDGSKGGSEHSALIAGRRPTSDGRCEYLIRNSWGVSCERYAAKKRGYECEENTGDLWVDSSTIAKTVFGVIHLDVK